VASSGPYSEKRPRSKPEALQESSRGGLRQENPRLKYAVRDRALTRGTIYKDLVVDIDGDGTFDDTLQMDQDFPTDVDHDEHGEVLPYHFELSQNYPNPFNPATTIEYSLPERSHVTIEVFNLIGQRVITLIDREEPAGSYAITWDGTTNAGKPTATGVYLYRFQAGDHVETKKMLLLK